MMPASQTRKLRHREALLRRHCWCDRGDLDGSQHEEPRCPVCGEVSSGDHGSTAAEPRAREERRRWRWCLLKGTLTGCPAGPVKQSKLNYLQGPHSKLHDTRGGKGLAASGCAHAPRVPGYSRAGVAAAERTCGSGRRSDSAHSEGAAERPGSATPRASQHTTALSWSLLGSKTQEELLPQGLRENLLQRQRQQVRPAGRQGAQSPAASPSPPTASGAPARSR